MGYQEGCSNSKVSYTTAVFSYGVDSNIGLMCSISNSHLRIKQLIKCDADFKKNQNNNYTRTSRGDQVKPLLLENFSLHFYISISNADNFIFFTAELRVQNYTVITSKAQTKKKKKGKKKAKSLCIVLFSRYTQEKENYPKNCPCPLFKRPLTNNKSGDNSLINTKYCHECY